MVRADMYYGSEAGTLLRLPFTASLMTINIGTFADVRVIMDNSIFY